MKRVHASVAVVWVLFTVSAAAATHSHTMWGEAQPAPPDRPENLTSLVSGTTVTLSWQPPTTGGVPTSYLLDASLSPGGPIVGSVSLPNTSITIPGVPNGTYYLRVRAVNSAGQSAPSNEIVLVVPGHGVGCTAPPEAPRNLTSWVWGTVIWLDWSPAVGGCPPTGYTVHAGSGSGLSNIAIVNLGLQPGLRGNAPFGTYFIRVFAVNANGGSPASNEKTITAAPSLTWLLGVVVDPNGLCVEGATVEVIRGQGLGQRIVQTTPCSYWDPPGFVFNDLIPGVEMTLRASAPGWSTEEATFVPYLGPQTAVSFGLSRIQ